MLAFADGYSASAYDVTSMYSNPASLAFLRFPSSASAGRMRVWDTGTITDNVAVAVPIFRKHTIAVGAMINHSGSGDPLPPSEVNHRDYGFDVGYAFAFITGLSAGLVASGRVMDVAGTRYQAGWLSLGVFYHPTPGISYGLNVRGLGSGIQYRREGDQTIAEEGVALQRTAEVALEMKFPAQAPHPTFVLAIATQRFMTDKVSRIKGGMEVIPLSWLIARMGYATGGGYNSWRGGLGLRYSGLSAEYTVAPGPPDLRLDTFTLTYVW